MRRRVWVTVLVTTVMLLVASSVLSAKPLLEGLVEKAMSLPLKVVALAMVSCIMWLVSLLKLYRSWVVRRNLVRVLARFGTPTSVIANTVQLSQDGVAFLTAASNDNRDPVQQEVFSGSGNRFTPFQTMRPLGDAIVTSTLAET